jgi:hypothetical protein
VCDRASPIGSSAQSAVVVRTLLAEYTWLNEHQPGATVLRRRDLFDAGKLLDILTLQIDGGDAREIYFDVSACFGNGETSPPCPYCGEWLRTTRARQCASCFADFHDLENVVFRKGSDYVDHVRVLVAARRELEARPLGLNDPCATFLSAFQSRRATAEVFILHFPDSLSAIDDRLFQIGIDCLRADGCRGVVCHVDRPLSEIGRSSTSQADSPVGHIYRRIHQFPRKGVRAVFVRADELFKAVEAVEGRPLTPFRMRFEDYDTEELAIAGLTARLHPDDDAVAQG